jgi:formyl-CoA transferase
VTAVPVGSFETATGPLYIACANDGTYRRLMQDVLKRPELVDDQRFLTSTSRRTNNEVLKQIISDALAKGKREDWLSAMQRAGVPAAAVRSVGEALDSDEVRSLGILGEAEHEKLGSIPNVGLPIRFSETPMRKPTGAPLLGSQTMEALRRVLNCNEERLAQLTGAGAFGNTSSNAE